ncbi:ABC transporter permease [Mangrovibacterium marinum]|uniref:ABC transporter permease n=1 Tax=Mangrovibacterium marinum TaxID=1639118 RepID=UPI002A18AFC1|nr:ABC transporter permease [Mangrovibacterium marinum]
MNDRTLAHKNILHYARYYKLAAVAILIAVMVIGGSLLTGNSVRSTLVNRVNERLGNTETVIFPQSSFLAEEFASSPVFGSSARGILLTNGFLSVSGRLVPVTVWGVDDMNIAAGSAKINPALSQEIGANLPGDLVLRLPASGLIPRGSLFVSESYTTSLRLSFDGIVSSEEGGNISLKNEQIIPFNLFINRADLAEAMETEGKINLILTDQKMTENELNESWNPSVSGLKVSAHDGFTEISSDRVFLPENVVKDICENNVHTNRLFSYLANSIRKTDESIPYSFVTAMDSYSEEHLKSDEIILSDYSAKRLNAQMGDSVWISYYTATALKNLKEDSLKLSVRKIVPIAELQADSTLSADFPGLSNVDRCTEWDADLPINMDLISKEDEDYWATYRSTPKAIISYQAIADKWKNAYGAATAVRIENGQPDLSKITAEEFGIQLIYPREAGLYAARNGVDFSSFFLSLGFFIILSAMLLLIIPFSEMIYQRRHEIALLKAIGYPRKRIVRILWTESAPVIVISAIGGVVAGFLYTALVMWLLGNVWQGATHTEGFGVYLNLQTILIGLFVGLLLSFGLIHRVIIRSLRERKQLKPVTSRKRLKTGAITASILSIILLLINIIVLQSVAVFMVIGVILIGTFALWGNFLLATMGNSCSTKLSTDKLKWKTIQANKKQAVLAFFSLAMGIFIVFSVGLNRQDFSDHSKILNGTGGYSLWCESSVPVYYDMNSPEGKAKLRLTDLPANTEVLQCLRHQADEASCLNLNKVSTPTVLAVDMAQLEASHFKIQKSLNDWNREQLFARMKTAADTVYPALVDATVLQWSLVKSIGDTLHYQADNGKDIAVQIVGTIANSVFQGNILMDRNLFSEIWKANSGSEVFLVKTSDEQVQSTKKLLTQALNEYGVIVTSTNDRLRQFNSVTDTYLSIFMTLGGLGLLLGIVAFIIVIRKNLTTRESEIKLYFTLGFNSAKIGQLLYRENLLVPVYALVAGIVGSLVAVAPNIPVVSLEVWLMALILSLFFLICIVLFVKKVVLREVSTIERQTDHLDKNP